MTQARRSLAIATTGVALALFGAGSAAACDRSGGSGGDYPATYPSETTTSSSSSSNSSSKAASSRAKARRNARRARAVRS